MASIAALLGESREPNWVKDFPVKGQGTIIFSIERDTKFYIVIRPKLDQGQIGADECISLTVDRDQAVFKMYRNQQVSTLKTVTGTIGHESVGYEPERKISYWFSYNRDMLVLKYGKGYCMEETTLMTHDFLHGLSEKEQEAKREEMQYLFSPYIRRRIEQYDELPLGMMIEKYKGIIKSVGRFRGKSLTESFPKSKESEEAMDAQCKALAVSLIDIERMVSFRKLPLTYNWSPFVLDSSKVNLYELDSSAHIFSASLPPACRELYENITAQDVELDWPYSIDKYKLSDAIAYSLKEGALKKKLESKQDEFGTSDPDKTYLRITLGKNRCSSPGIPYVLEIWPAGHGSPIHNHGNTYAVIKVLHGGLTVRIYNKHADTTTAHPLQEFPIKKGDCTWISPNWFQTHELWNYHDEYCATMQCYQYGENNFTQWPYFDYVADTEVIDEFLPNSDFSFREMASIVMAEYTEHMKKEEAEKAMEFVEKKVNK